AAAANRRLAIIDVTTMIRDLRHRANDLVHALRRANIAGLLPCVDGLEALPTDDPATRDIVRQILDEHPGPLAVRLPKDSDPPLAPGYLRIELPALTMEQRIESWRTLLAEHSLFVRDTEEIADRYRVGPGVIAKVCEQVAARKRPADGENVDDSLAIENAVRQHLES